MLHTLAQNWWALALRGLVAVLFGLLTFFLPGNHAGDARAARRSLRLSGRRFNVIVFFRLMSHHWALLIEGAIGIIAGILTFGWPAITALVLLYVIAFWAIFTGIFEIVAGIRLRKQSPTNGCYLQWASSLCCLASRSSMRPGLGPLAIVLWIGAYALVFGIILLAFAFRLRGTADFSRKLAA